MKIFIQLKNVVMEHPYYILTASLSERKVKVLLKIPLRLAQSWRSHNGENLKDLIPHLWVDTCSQEQTSPPVVLNCVWPCAMQSIF